MIVGFIGTAILIVIQLVTFAYGYGKIHQRVSSIDKRLNDLSHSLEAIEKRVGKLEGRK